MKKIKVHYLAQRLANPTHPISIAVIGTGGTGSHVLSNIAQVAHALIQIGRQNIHVTAYDDDVVSEDNIGRQLFSPADVNRFKSVLLIERINRFYGFSWDAVPEKFSHESDKANILISCVDSIASRKSIDTAIKAGLAGEYYNSPYYWMDIGNERDHGQIVLGTLRDFESHNPKCVKLKTFFQLFRDIKEENTGESCSANMIYNKQNLFINKFMATFACNMLWHLLYKYYIDYQGCFINLDRFMITKIPIKQTTND